MTARSSDRNLYFRVNNIQIFHEITSRNTEHSERDRNSPLVRARASKLNLHMILENVMMAEVDIK